jgi:diketogulonate reductase-like aldo/keto reductase
LRGDSCAELVAAALDLGYRHVDTAAIYGHETDVGRGLRDASVRREDVFLTTKVWYTDIAPDNLKRSAEANIKRLGLDHVDLLLIHWPNPNIPLEGPFGLSTRPAAQA